MRRARVDAPRRVQLSRRKGWRIPENAVVVARPAAWGNPWRVGRDGNAEYCVEQFRRLLLGQSVAAWPNDAGDTERAIRMGDAGCAHWMLRGKNLACWCALGEPCHADVLLKIANG